MVSIVYEFNLQSAVLSAIRMKRSIISKWHIQQTDSLQVWWSALNGEHRNYATEAVFVTPEILRLNLKEKSKAKPGEKSEAKPEGCRTCFVNFLFYKFTNYPDQQFDADSLVTQFNHTSSTTQLNETVHELVHANFASLLNL